MSGRSLVRGLLQGKTACITGGTTGIGRAIALEYLRQGANVAVNHLDLDRDQELKRSMYREASDIKSQAPKETPSGNLIDVAGDVGNPEVGESLVSAAVKSFGGLDILVSNAGIFKPAAFLDLSKKQFDQTMHVNVNGAFYTCQAAARQMVNQGRGGSIIAISSISALQGGGMQVHYTPSKAAISSMVQSMAISLAPHKIRCNALLPGTVHTQLADEEMNDRERRAKLEAKIPLGSGKPEDLAGPAVFLGSEQLSSWLTGSQILVDGGMFAHLQ